MKSMDERRAAIKKQLRGGKEKYPSGAFRKRLARNGEKPELR